MNKIIHNKIIDLIEITAKKLEEEHWRLIKEKELSTDFDYYIKVWELSDLYARLYNYIKSEKYNEKDINNNIPDFSDTSEDLENE